MAVGGTRNAVGWSVGSSQGAVGMSGRRTFGQLSGLGLVLWARRSHGKKGLELGRVMVSWGFGKMSLALLLEGTEYREAAGTGEGRLHEGGTGKGRSPRKDAE